ncbi:MAG: hypothetical protein WDO14_24725 [Bacteroidota bacterium]
MKVTKHILPVVISVALQHAVFGQRNVMEILDPQYQNSSLLYAKTTPNDNPFFVNDFLSADIVMFNKQVIPAVDIKYDVENQRLYASTGGRFVILDNKMIDSFKVQLPDTGSKSTFIKLKEDGKEVYFEVLAEGEVKLLKKTVKTRQTRTEANSTPYNNDGETRPARYRRNEFYYLQTQDGLHIVRLNAKSILKTLNASKYEDCAKNLELRLNQLEDIIILVKQCK